MNDCKDSHSEGMIRIAEEVIYQLKFWGAISEVDYKIIKRILKNSMEAARYREPDIECNLPIGCLADRASRYQSYRVKVLEDNWSRGQLSNHDFVRAL